MLKCFRELSFSDGSVSVLLRSIVQVHRPVCFLECIFVGCCCSL